MRVNLNLANVDIDNILCEECGKEYSVENVELDAEYTIGIETLCPYCENSNYIDINLKEDL